MITSVPVGGVRVRWFRDFGLGFSGTSDLFGSPDTSGFELPVPE